MAGHSRNFGLESFGFQVAVRFDEKPAERSLWSSSTNKRADICYMMSPGFIVDEPRDGKQDDCESMAPRPEKKPQRAEDVWGFNDSFKRLSKKCPVDITARPAIYSGPVVVAGGRVPQDAELTARVGDYESIRKYAFTGDIYQLVVEPESIEYNGQIVEFYLNGHKSVSLDRLRERLSQEPTSSLSSLGYRRRHRLHNKITA